MYVYILTQKKVPIIDDSVLHKIGIEANRICFCIFILLLNPCILSVLGLVHFSLIT